MSNIANNNCPWIRSKDFESFSVVVSMENMVAQVWEGKGQVELLQLESNGCILTLPTKSCATGQIISLKIKRQIIQTLELNAIPHLLPEIIASAKVISIEELLTNSSLITAKLKFIQVDQKEWKTFLASYADKQTEINNRLKKIQE